MHEPSGSVCFVANGANFFRLFGPAVAAAEARGLKPIALLPVRDDHPSFNSKVQVVPSPIDGHRSLRAQLLSVLRWHQALEQRQGCLGIAWMFG